MTPAHQLFNQRLKQQQLQLRLTVAVLVTWVFTMLTSVHKDSETALFLLDEWLALSLREISIFSMTHLAKDWEEFLYNFCSTLKTVNLPRGQRLSRFTCTTLLSRPLVSWQIIIAKLLRLEELLINLHLLLFWIFYIHNSDSALIDNNGINDNKEFSFKSLSFPTKTVKPYVLHVNTKYATCPIASTYCSGHINKSSFFFFFWRSSFGS